MIEIVQEPNSILRLVSKEVPIDSIKTDSIKKVISDMKLSLSSQEDGVAIAAPQIGINLRIFVVSKKASKQFNSDMTFLNPEIIRIGKNKVEISEGCLSVRWKYGIVKRSLTATVKAYNEDGNVFVISGRGLLAQIFQHEIDHLNGTLFIDKAKNLENIPPEINVKK